MKILLVRHGIAEEKNPEKNDYDRKLTGKGTEELKENFPDLALYLKDKSVKLLSSPLVRAKETADILKSLIPGLHSEIREYIASGDIQGLKEDYLRYKKDFDYLIITGHAPSLDIWTEDITSVKSGMEKGSVTEIEITYEDEWSGRVNWHLKPSELQRLTQFERFLKKEGAFYNDIKDKVTESISVILKMRENYLDKPAEIESVHKLRVKTRQFRSLISFLKPLLGKRSYTLMQNDLRALAQECAYLRELDVLMKEWKTHDDRFKEAKVKGDAFYKVMEEERRAEQDRLYSYLEKPDAAMMLNEVKNTVLKTVNPSKIKYVTLEQMLFSTLSKWHDRIKHDYENIDSNNLVIIHALRIKAKKMRYIMEVFGKDKDEATREMYQEVKKWQEVIGDITDANRNSEAVNEIVQKYPDREEELMKEVVVFNEIQKENADSLYMEFFGKPSHEIDLFSDSSKPVNEKEKPSKGESIEEEIGKNEKTEIDKEESDSEKETE